MGENCKSVMRREEHERLIEALHLSGRKVKWAQKSGNLALIVDGEEVGAGFVPCIYRNDAMKDMWVISGVYESYRGTILPRKTFRRSMGRIANGGDGFDYTAIANYIGVWIEARAEADEKNDARNRWEKVAQQLQCESKYRGAVESISSNTSGLVITTHTLNESEARAVLEVLKK